MKWFINDKPFDIFTILGIRPKQSWSFSKTEEIQTKFFFHRDIFYRTVILKVKIVFVS